MALTIQEVEHVALLARLDLRDDEKQKYAEQLGAVLDYMEILKRLPTENVEPLAHVLSLFNVMREDIKRPPFPKSDILANAPEQEDGYFKVPRII